MGSLLTLLSYVGEAVNIMILNISNIGALVVLISERYKSGRKKK